MLLYTSCMRCLAGGRQIKARGQGHHNAHWIATKHDDAGTSAGSGAAAHATVLLATRAHQLGAPPPPQAATASKQCFTAGGARAPQGGRRGQRLVSSLEVACEAPIGVADASRTLPICHNRN